MTTKQASLYCAIVIVVLCTAGAVTAGVKELFVDEPINGLVSGFLEAEVVAAFSILGYHIGSNGNGNGNGSSKL